MVEFIDIALIGGGIIGVWFILRESPVVGNKNYGQDKSTSPSGSNLKSKSSLAESNKAPFGYIQGTNTPKIVSDDVSNKIAAFISKAQKAGDPVWTVSKDKKVSNIDKAAPLLKKLDKAGEAAKVQAVKDFKKKVEENGFLQTLVKSKWTSIANATGKVPSSLASSQLQYGYGFGFGS